MGRHSFWGGGAVDTLKVLRSMPYALMSALKRILKAGPNLRRLPAQWQEEVTVMCHFGTLFFHLPGTFPPRPNPLCNPGHHCPSQVRKRPLGQVKSLPRVKCAVSNRIECTTPKSGLNTAAPRVLCQGKITPRMREGTMGNEDCARAA